MANKNLNNAKDAKNDEFYTNYNEISSELKHYSKFLKGKIIFCNCDDPTWSNFWRYLHVNFSVLGLKKLISTHYEPFNIPSYKMEYEGGNDLDINVGKLTPLKENGDFRSEECILIMKESDVIITNPPFSLFRDYMAQLMEYNKKFIIIGTMNSLHYKEIFPLIKENKIWVGYSFNKTMEFIMPNSYELKGKAFIDSDGRKHGFVPGILWYTNFDIKKRHEPFFPPEDAHCYYEGNEDRYPIYSNFDAIDVDSVARIPIDYCGKMGVPDTFLDKYNPQEFELIGIGSGTMAASIGVKRNYRGRTDIAIALPNGKNKCPYSRIIIRNRNPISKKDDV